MKSFQHQDTEMSSAVNHNIYKRTFLLLPVENQFVPYCWCLTPNFVCWLPLPSKQFKVQRRPHIVGRCINSTNIRWYVCASFTVGQNLCINRLFSLGTLDLFISQIFIFSFINFPSFLILLISVLWPANDRLSSHLSFLFLTQGSSLMSLSCFSSFTCFFSLSLLVFSHTFLSPSLTFQFIDCLPSILLPYSWTHLLLPSSLFFHQILNLTHRYKHTPSFCLYFLPLLLFEMSLPRCCQSCSSPSSHSLQLVTHPPLSCVIFSPRCASVLMLVEIY